jgi:hypothetical protein
MFPVAVLPVPGWPGDTTGVFTGTPTPARRMHLEVTMTCRSSRLTGSEAELADLDLLAAQLVARGLSAKLRTPEGRLPYLDVTNPGVSVLTERVYAQADAYWYGWAEQIADCADAAKAADRLAHGLGVAPASTASE